MKKHKNFKVKYILLLIIILSVLSMVVMYINYRDTFLNEEKQVSASDEKASMVLDGVHQVSTKEGKKEWVLDAKSAILNDEKKTMNLKEPRVVFYLKNNEQVFLTAEHGILKTDTKDITATGDVIVKNKNYTFFTDELNYDNKKRLIFSNSPVKIIGKATSFTANKMQYFIDSNKAQLQGNVDGFIKQNTPIKD